VTQERTPVSPEAKRLTLHPPLETSQDLLALIERAKGRKMTPEEIDAQRRSWVRGQMGLTDPTRTPEQIDAALDAVLGPPLSAQLAAAREAGRLEGDAAGYRRGMEEAAQMVERDEIDSSVRLDPAKHPNLGAWLNAQRAAAIRAKLEGK